ncbi:MAG: class I SAM-dependent methyltransferase [Holophagales bacterium]|nr:MAG: class I SAM-dependent methyltransferase [Holophagales bacterium]
MVKRYDRAYFDRWYRDPRRRIETPGELARRVAAVVALAEYVLERPLRTVLDVGCGEGRWLAPLRRLRPRVRYLGLDSSVDAVTRFGARRNLRLVSFADLPDLDLPSRDRGPFDLVVCSDVLHYLEEDEIHAGLPALSRLTGGVAHLAALCAEDEVEGDLQGFHRRSDAWYRERFARLGLVSCGLQCYLPAERADELAALERGPLPTLC